MTIQPLTPLSIYPTQQSLTASRQNVAVDSQQFADTVTISAAARSACAESNQCSNSEVAERLDKINLIDMEDFDYLYTHDSKFAAIHDKAVNSPDGAIGGLTSSELDYHQKASGGVNSMAYLSTDEKQLYDKLVSEGNTAAVRGLENIAFIRLGFGTMAGGLAGTPYDSTNTPISSETIRKYFSHSVDNSTGQIAAAQLNALAQYLQINPMYKGIDVTQ